MYVVFFIALLMKITQPPKFEPVNESDSRIETANSIGSSEQVMPGKCKQLVSEFIHHF